MHWEKLLYQIGCWAFILLGVGHLLTHWLAPRSAEQEAMHAVMRQFAVRLPGSDGNLYQYHIGFSAMMGALLVAYGAQALLVLTIQPPGWQISTRLWALHSGVAALSTLLSVVFFFAVPVVFMTVACTAFGLGWLLARGVH